MNSLCRLTTRLTIGATRVSPIASAPCLNVQIRSVHWPAPIKAKPGSKCLWRIVHFPEEYTVKPLDVTNLAGRDPDNGRVTHKTIGGGIKHKYRWIKWLRDGPAEGPPKEERVLQIFVDGNRTAHVALVASGEELKHILATENMKPGDIIRTSRELPRIPVRPNEGDAYLLGALPNGTLVHNIEALPGFSGTYVHAAGSYATIIRKEKERVIVQMPTKRMFSFNQRCMAVVGRLSNVIHSSIPIGSAQRLRWLGYRPRSGLWQRKSGKHGRKIKRPKKMVTMRKFGKAAEKLTLTLAKV